MGQEAFHYVCLRVAPRSTQYKHTSLPLKEDLLPCVCVCVCVCVCGVCVCAEPYVSGESLAATRSNSYR